MFQIKVLGPIALMRRNIPKSSSNEGQKTQELIIFVVVSQYSVELHNNY